VSQGSLLPGFCFIQQRRFKSFQSAKNTLAGIELMHMIRKNQLNIADVDKMSFAEQFYALAGKFRPA